jgi:hypothetical protein
MQPIYINTLRTAIKALDKNILELSRIRRGLNPYELTAIKYDLESAREARQELIDYIKQSGFEL